MTNENLDHLDEDELFTVITHGTERQSHYASLVFVAAMLRLEGKVDDALKVESRAEDVYDLMSEDEKW